MADNYVESSFLIETLTDKEMDWWKTENQRWNPADSVEPEDLDPLFSTQWVLEEKERQVWFNGETAFDPEAAANVIQRFLKAHRPAQAVWFSWSETCSKPRIDEFCGGGVFVTAEKIYWNSVWQWIEQQKTASDENSLLLDNENAKAAKEALMLLNRVFLNWTRYGLRSRPMFESLKQVQDVLSKLGGPWDKKSS